MKKSWNWTLTFLALAFLIAYSYPAFVVEINPSSQSILDGIQWVSWIAFAADLLFGIYSASNKIQFLKRHPLEILAVILPFLRPLRLLRFISFGTLVFEKVNLGKSIAITFKVIVTALFLTYLAEHPLEHAVNVLVFMPGKNLDTRTLLQIWKQSVKTVTPERLRTLS